MKHPRRMTSKLKQICLEFASRYKAEVKENKHFTLVETALTALKLFPLFSDLVRRFFPSFPLRPAYPLSVSSDYASSAEKGLFK